jgi:DnaK suppressor protein
LFLQLSNFEQFLSRLSAIVSDSMAVIWIEEPDERLANASPTGRRYQAKDRRMDAKKIKDIRRRLSSEYENRIKSINRNRTAAYEIKLENTEDEGDLATISHERELLYSLHESDFARLRFIREAMKAMDRGQYGECVRCGEEINVKRLEAVPWATMCLRCQEGIEADRTSSRMALVGLEGEETEL